MQFDNVGDLIKNMLSAQGLTQKDLAEIAGLSRQTISNLVLGRSNLTPETAVILAAALGNDASEWLNLDSQHRLSLVSKDVSAIKQRALLFQSAPVRDMQRRGWIPETATDSAHELEGNLKEFFGAENLANVATLQVSYRRNENLCYSDKAAKAWCFYAKKLAYNVPIQMVYKEENMPRLIELLRRIAAYQKEAYRVAQAFAKYGIRLVIVEPLPKSKVDGAAFWLDDNSPVIALSMRYDRMDYFWFTLMHELKHIEHRDAFSIDVDTKLSLEKEGENDSERRANQEAAESLIPSHEIESFIRRFSPLYSEERIIQFANRIKIHPSIIVGQLQHRGEIKYKQLGKLKPKVRDIVTKVAMTDGWGKVAVI